MILSETAPLGTDSAAPHSFRHVRRRKTTQDLVYEQIRDALSAGTFEAGRSFTITSMADQFGTSHMPVREALRRLVAEHALELDSTGTARVPLTTPEGLDHLCDARCIVERAAAELAFPGFHAAAIDALDAVALTHVEALRQGDAARMLSSNREFHFMIYEASGNPVLINLIQNLWLRYGPYVRLLTDRMTEMLKQDAAGSYSKHHLELIAALRRGDGKGAGAMLGLDQNNAHVDHRGLYHYHAMPTGLLKGNTSTLVGFAADGFEIHYVGSKAKSGYSLKPGNRSGGPGGRHDGTYLQDWQFTGGTGTLDQCNGGRLDGRFVYFVTDSYPYFPHCAWGEISRDFARP